MLSPSRELNFGDLVSDWSSPILGPHNSELASPDWTILGLPSPNRSPVRDGIVCDNSEASSGTTPRQDQLARQDSGNITLSSANLNQPCIELVPASPAMSNNKLLTDGDSLVVYEIMGMPEETVLNAAMEEQHTGDGNSTLSSQHDGHSLSDISATNLSPSSEAVAHILKTQQIIDVRGNNEETLTLYSRSGKQVTYEIVSQTQEGPRKTTTMTTRRSVASKTAHSEPIAGPSRVQLKRSASQDEVFPVDQPRPKRGRPSNRASVALAEPTIIKQETTRCATRSTTAVASSMVPLSPYSKSAVQKSRQKKKEKVNNFLDRVADLEKDFVQHPNLDGKVGLKNFYDAKELIIDKFFRHECYTYAMNKHREEKPYHEQFLVDGRQNRLLYHNSNKERKASKQVQDRKSAEKGRRMNLAKEKLIIAKIVALEEHLASNLVNEVQAKVEEEPMNVEVHEENVGQFNSENYVDKVKVALLYAGLID